MSCLSKPTPWLKLVRSRKPLTLTAGQRSAIDVAIIGKTTGTGTLSFTLSHADGLSVSQTQQSRGARRTATGQPAPGHHPE